MSDYQLYLIALVASVAVFVLNKAYRATGKKVPEAVLTVGVYVVSFALAVAWQGFAFPSAPVCAPSDPGACASAWLAVITQVLQSVGGYVAFAALIYQALLKKIMESYVPAAFRRVFKRPAKG